MSIQTPGSFNILFQEVRAEVFSCWSYAQNAAFREVYGYLVEKGGVKNPYQNADDWCRDIGLTEKKIASLSAKFKKIFHKQFWEYIESDSGCGGLVGGIDADFENYFPDSLMKYYKKNDWEEKYWDDNQEDRITCWLLHMMINAKQNDV